MVDGTDAATVFAAAAEAVERARADGGPTLLDLQVPRLVPHSSQDDEHYRTDEERERTAALDPLPKLEDEVLRRGLLDEEAIAALWQSTHDSVRADVERAIERPAPDPARARQWLFAGDPPHEYASQLEREPLPPGVFRS
jgi:pyruvate dehydrogenase E1 component alpha subunit